MSPLLYIIIGIIGLILIFSVIFTIEDDPPDFNEALKCFAKNFRKVFGMVFLVVAVGACVGAVIYGLVLLVN